MRILAITVFIFSSFLCSAQLRYGGSFSGGISYHSAKSSFDDGSKVSRFTSPISYGLSAIVEYELKENITLCSGLGFTVKGMGYSYERGTDSTYQTLWKAMNKKMVYNTFYLRVPITARYFVNIFEDPNMSPFIHGGFATDINIIDSKPRGNGIDRSVDFNYHKTVDLNLILGLGLKFQTRDLHQLSVSMDFYKGLLNNTTGDYGDAQQKFIMRNNQLLFTLGYTVSKAENTDPVFGASQL